MAIPWVQVGLVELEIKGLDQIERNLKILREEFGVKTGGIINHGLMRGARLIRDAAKDLAPVLRETSAMKMGRWARRHHFAGHALSQTENTRLSGNLRDNIIAHYVRADRPTVWVRVRTKSYIFAPRRGPLKIRYRSGWVAASKGTDPSNLVGNPNYWWLQEFGYKGRPGKAFMRKAFEANKVRAAELAADNMRWEINKLGEQFGRKLRGP